jgi:tRNA/rRNA methyltransferase
MKPLENIRIILVDPQTAGNIGAVCRGMMNMGITDLALVAPHDRLDWEDARQRACHADSLLEQRRIFPTLEAAVADCTVVAGTSARTGMYRDHAGLPREIAPLIMDSAAQHQAALVFGREDTGLTNEELALCTHIINIPSSGLYRSLNLSHAVMICTYELFLLANDPSYEPPRENSSQADSAMRERLFAAWGGAMLEIGFCKPEKLTHMMLGLRRIFNRGKLTGNDVKILMGLARQARWVAAELNKERTAAHRRLPE